MQIDTRIHGRPCAGEQRSGDAGLVHVVDGVTWVLLVDVLGHGNEAADVADLAVEAAARFDARITVETAFMQLNDRLTGSRGAAAALLRFAGRELSTIGVGNVEVRTLQGTAVPYLAARGVLGRRLPPPRALSIELSGPGRLLLMTDGIDRRAPLSVLATLDDDTLCERLLGEHALERDDATFIHLRYA